MMICKKGITFAFMTLCIVFFSYTTLANDYPTVTFHETLSPGEIFEWKITKFEVGEQIDETVGPSFEKGDILSIEINKSLDDNVIIGENYSYYFEDRIYHYYLNDKEMDRGEIEALYDWRGGLPWFLPLRYVTASNDYDYIKLVAEFFNTEFDGEQFFNQSQGDWIIEQVVETEIILEDKSAEYTQSIQYLNEWRGGSGYVLNWSFDFIQTAEYSRKTGILQNFQIDGAFSQFDYNHTEQTYIFNEGEQHIAIKLRGISIPFSWHYSILAFLTLSPIIIRRKKKSR